MRKMKNENPNKTRSSIKNTTISDARQETGDKRQKPFQQGDPVTADLLDMKPEPTKTEILSQTLGHVITGVDSGAIPVN